MRTVLWLACWISLIYSAFSSCVRLATYIPVGEPGCICCPLSSEKSNHTVAWYRNGTNTPITTNKDARIHQQEDVLSFIPASIEDSGYYECSINNTKRASMELKIFKNDDGLCYSRIALYQQRVYLGRSGPLTCPALDNCERKNTLLDLKWYKACSPLTHERFWSIENKLSIKNVTKEDEGIYVCQTTYTYMGKEYNVSRAINATVLVPSSRLPPEIISPKNNSIEVDLGSHVVMDCRVSSYLVDVIVFWKVNGESLNSMYKEELYTYKSSSRKWIVGSRFNISATKKEDYLKYVCIVQASTVRESAAFIVLKRPALNIQGYLIGGLVSSLFVILASVFLYKVFKVDIVLWYRESCQPLLSKEVSDGKLYDAYVLYPKNGANCKYSSDIFVLKLLPEVLEKQCGYNLFIFGRDDLPGQAMVSVVDETIKQSRRVIIVLVSDSSCYSMHKDTCEHDIAVYNALIRDGIKVILIELDKIKDYTSMPESIKYLKQKHGVLTWRKDSSEKSQMATAKFWKKVRYQMPATQTPPPSDLPLLPVMFNSSSVSKG